MSTMFSTLGRAASLGLLVLLLLQQLIGQVRRSFSTAFLTNADLALSYEAAS